MSSGICGVAMLFLVCGVDHRSIRAIYDCLMSKVAHVDHSLAVRLGERSFDRGAGVQ
jgi:hypothetical protein